MSFSKPVNLTYAQTAVPCSVCEDETPGEYYCIDCKHTLCLQCEKSHRKFTRGHNVVLRAQIGDIDTTTLTCVDHGDQAIFHCEKCNIPTCAKCITGKHKGHAMSDLADILEKEKKMLQDDIEELQRAQATLLKQREEILLEKENCKENTTKILKDMDDEFQELQRIHTKRVNDVNSLQESNMSVFDGLIEDVNTKMTICGNLISKYQDAMAKSSLPALRKVTRGKESMPDIGRKPKLPTPPIFVPGKLQSVLKNLGKLNISSSSMSKPLKQTAPTVVSKFQCPLQGEPSMCITKKGDVWFGGDQSRELVLVDIKGQVLKRRKIRNRPYSLAAMDCGDVIISPRSADSKSVSRLHSDGREQYVYDTSPSWSNGVSVTADQKILICIGDGRVLRINSDGSHAEKIYECSGKDSAFQCVEQTNRNIYISDWKNGTVMMISKYGTFLSTGIYKKKRNPQGIVVDTIGNILYADNANDCVDIVDQNLHSRELVGPSCGIKKPGWLAVDRDNNLWIAQDTGNILVVKYLS